jgi:hypothetical protein
VRREDGSGRAIQLHMQSEGAQGATESEEQKRWREISSTARLLLLSLAAHLTASKRNLSCRLRRLRGLKRVGDSSAHAERGSTGSSRRGNGVQSAALRGSKPFATHLTQLWQSLLLETGTRRGKR